MSLEARDRSRVAARLPLPRGPVPGSLLFLGGVGLMRLSSVHAGCGIALLALVPVIYTALYVQRRRPMALVLLAYTAVCAVPMAVGGSGSSVGSWALVSALGCGMGLLTLRLVSRVRTEALEAGRRERTLERVAAVVREMIASEDPRTDVCRATLEVTDASVAILFERNAADGALRSTAMAGRGALSEPLVLSDDDPAMAVLRAGRARLLTDPLTRPVAGPAMWEACGRAESILYQPLLRGGVVGGVMVVAWDAAAPVTAARETVVELLAAEAALVLDRADELTVLAGMARTDPLTGLPNRRAWDARCARAMRDGEEVAVAILDIDHFKRFNDTFGHQAGDRLLRDTAAAWRDLLRAGDLLARIGGEEFGLLLVGCPPEVAGEVTERLRQAVTGDQTCSAGLAVRRPGESIESVLERADRALYDVKAHGRDDSRIAA